nr:reverse transcriptase domain-containing protein [Tanacetum cinerariifolium]
MQTTEEKIDTSKALDTSLVDTESSGTESKKQDTSIRSGNDAHADDANIRPIYDEEPMVEKYVFNANHDSCVTQFLNVVNSRAKVPSNKTTYRNKPVDKISVSKKPERQLPKGYRFTIKKTSVVHEKTMTLRSCLRWKSMGKIFKTFGLRWVPTGKIFTSSITKVDSEPTNGSNEDITNNYEYEQTLDVSACTLNLSVGDAVTLMTFPFLLSGEPKTWLNELNEGTFTSWNEMRKAFISRYFSLAKFKRLLNEIQSFYQLGHETLVKAWLRIKEMLCTCYRYGLTKGAIVQIFYHGLDDPTQGILNVGGIFLYKTPNEAFKILDDKIKEPAGDDPEFGEAFMFLDEKDVCTESLPRMKNVKPRHEVVYKPPRSETRMIRDYTVHIPYTNAKMFADVVLSNHIGDKELKTNDDVGNGVLTKKEIKKNDMGLPKELNKEWKLNDKVVPHNKKDYHYLWHPTKIPHLNCIIKES